MKKQVSIGLDFGTLSVRGVALCLETGEIISSHVSDFKHGIIEDRLPKTDVELPSRWALQHPGDYIDSMEYVLEKVINDVREEYKIVSIGTDFTSSTVMPVNKHFRPLMESEMLYDNPHSWPKLWKHHAAQEQATKINDLANDKNEKWIDFYGGKVSAEWLFPKALQILEEDPKLYKKIDKFIEAGDWITFILTGKEVRSNTMAGFKAMFAESNFPSKDFLAELNQDFATFVNDKLSEKYYLPTDKAGYLTDKYLEKFRLDYDVPVAVSIIDAHAAIGSIPEIAGDIMMCSIGTSSCDILMNEERIIIPGISGIVKDGIIDGYYAYEAGQSAVGDIFSWFIENVVPDEYYKNADKLGLNIYDYMESLIEDIPSGETGLLALDWFNGNRSILMDADLTGMIIGLRIDTKPEYIYRALIEATAFGKKITLDQFEQQGVKINKLLFAGGLPQKNNEFNRIYSDILNKEITISEYSENGAVGSAIFGSVAAGVFENLQDAVKILKTHDKVVDPIPDNVDKYSSIYAEYRRLYEYFGNENLVMKKI